MDNFLPFLVQGVAIGSGYSLLASGFVAIYRVTHIINFAQGTFAVVGAFVTVSLLSAHMWFVPAVLLGLLAAALSGLVVGLLAAYRPTLSPLSSLVITLGCATAAYALEIAIWGDQPLSFAGLTGVFKIGPIVLERQYVVVIAAAVLLLAAFRLFFIRTYLGKALSATASNRHAAQIVGIPVRWMSLLAFSVAGLLGGVGRNFTNPTPALFVQF